MGVRNYTVHLTCSKETKDLILNNCVEEFVKHHKEFRGMKISQGLILKKIAEYYLEE